MSPGRSGMGFRRRRKPCRKQLRDRTRPGRSRSRLQLLDAPSGNGAAKDSHALASRCRTRRCGSGQEVRLSEPRRRWRTFRGIRFGPARSRTWVSSTGPVAGFGASSKPRMASGIPGASSGSSWLRPDGRLNMLCVCRTMRPSSLVVRTISGGRARPEAASMADEVQPRAGAEPGSELFGRFRAAGGGANRPVGEKLRVPVWTRLR